MKRFLYSMIYGQTPEQKETKTFVEKANPQLIKQTYKNREKEIISLFKYDRGEKTIYAPDLRNLVQTVR